MATPKPRGRRRLRIVLAGALVLLLAFLGAWQSYWMRHKILRAVTGVEGACYFALPSESAEPDAAVAYLHRAKAGDSANSAAAIQAARGNTPAIEIDICFSSDFVPFLSHGDDFPGATPHSLDLQNLSAAEIAGMRRNDGEPFLRLEAFIAEYAADFPHVLLDAKTDHAAAGEKAAALAACLGGQGRFRITSLSGRFLWELRDRAPELLLGCESFGPLASWLAGFGGYHARINEVSEGQDGAARGLGLSRLYYVVESEAAVRRAGELKPECTIVTPEFAR